MIQTRVRSSYIVCTAINDYSYIQYETRKGSQMVAGKQQKELFGDTAQPVVHDLIPNLSSSFFQQSACCSHPRVSISPPASYHPHVPAGN